MTTKYTLFYKRTLFTKFSSRIYQPIYTCTLMTLAKSLTFNVTKQTPELIPPAKTTPHELKPLSVIDHIEALRIQVPVIQFYRKNPSVEADPVEVIRTAVAKALVPYYPFAGRLREDVATRELEVECTGEGVIFTEAEADVTLEQFGGDLHPPIPCLDKLLYDDVPGSDGIINAPLLLIQVTRLKCGGFIFSLCYNHVMTDGAGIAQFMSAVGELALGAEAPSTPPVWERHLLSQRHPPRRVACTHHEHVDDDIPNTGKTLNIPTHADHETELVHRSFFFGPAEISALRRHLPPHLRHCTTTFELLTACLWRCRTASLSPDPNEEVTILWPMNIRRLSFNNPPIPDGYYGNCFIVPSAKATAGSLSENPFHYAVELVRKTKTESMADPTSVRDSSSLSFVGTYAVTDVRHLGFEDVDFGWGEPVYGGLAEGNAGNLVPGMRSCYMAATNNKGENGVLVPVYLPMNAMDVFIKELDIMVNNDGNNPATALA